MRRKGGDDQIKKILRLMSEWQVCFGAVVLTLLYI